MLSASPFLFYLPFCWLFATSQELAKKKALLPLLDAAKERAEQLRKQRAERRKAAGAPAAESSEDDDDNEDTDM